MTAAEKDVLLSVTTRWNEAGTPKASAQAGSANRVGEGFSVQLRDQIRRPIGNPIEVRLDNYGGYVYELPAASEVMTGHLTIEREWLSTLKEAIDRLIQNPRNHTTEQQTLISDLVDKLGRSMLGK